MPYTVAVSFDRFIENIGISGDQHQTCIVRRDHIVSLLKNDFTILDAFASGSIPKRTAVKGSDLDVIVQLHYGKHIKDKKPSKVLQDVRDALAEYRTGARKNGQAVTLYYQTWPNVDLVPVTGVRDDNGNLVYYEVPDMNREQWIASNPKKHAANIAAQASTFGSEFRRIVRMIKWWNQCHSNYLQSYHIEVLALQILNGSFSDYSWNIYQFFDQAYKSVYNSFLWYEHSYVDSYLDYADRQEALKRLATARDKARSAWYATYGTNDNHEEAIGIWKQIFGDKFPTYKS